MAVVQPRTGFGRVETMRRSLETIAALDFAVVGTITIDSHTRAGEYAVPLQRLAAGEELNGYPLVSHSGEATRAMLDGLYGPEFPVQVRHGTALPRRLFERLVEVGLDATEGGPVSYCLPYSRVPLAEAVAAWADSCRFLAGATEHGHVESFGGCLLGQLCPPSLLVAMSVLEGCFFRQQGLGHMSLSYAQGTLDTQDRGALQALRSLASAYLGDVDWHLVFYTYMGVFPRSRQGATRLIRDSARVARDAGCERLIVKTVSESRQIPTVADNVAALRLAAAELATAPGLPGALDDAFRQETEEEARGIIDAVLDLHPDVGAALVAAFHRGLLDIPYCLHRDNRSTATGVLDDRGALVWGSVGNLPLPAASRSARTERLSSNALYAMLNHVAHRYDSAAPEVPAPRAPAHPARDRR